MTSPALEHLVQFLDEPDTEEEAGLVAGMARVLTVAGPLMVPGTRHLDVPHLAVTRRNLGTFDVTHLPTGVTVLRDFDTMGAALLALAQLHAIRVRYALDFATTDTAALRDTFADVDGLTVPFTCWTTCQRPSVGQWLQTAREHGTGWVLPWESPAQFIREAVEMIAMAQPITVHAPATEVPRVS